MAGFDSFCGIYCGACLCNIAREAGNVEETAKKLNRTIQQLTCTECKTALHEDCCFVTCCTSKGLDNCSECPDMPCEKLTEFANDGYYHHAFTIKNLFRIREIGVEAWLEEEKRRYTCPMCGARTGWSYVYCEACGHDV